MSNTESNDFDLTTDVLEIFANAKHAALDCIEASIEASDKLPVTLYEEVRDLIVNSELFCERKKFLQMLGLQGINGAADADLRRSMLQMYVQVARVVIGPRSSSSSQKTITTLASFAYVDHWNLPEGYSEDTSLEELGRWKVLSIETRDRISRKNNTVGDLILRKDEKTWSERMLRDCVDAKEVRILYKILLNIGCKPVLKA